MKKIISLVLLLSLCLGLFAGCDLTQFIPGNKPVEPASNLENAKSLVFNTYKPANKDEIPVKSADFEVMTSVLVEGESFPVAWTVEVTAGAKDAVKIVDGSSAAFKKVDLTEKPEEEVQFTLTATISDAEGNTETVSFEYKTLKFEAPTADKIVLKVEGVYLTGTEKPYNDKMQVTTSDKIADAIALTVVENADGTNSFKTEDGYFLYADDTHVQFVKEEGDHTKFVLDAVAGGYTIKCSKATYKDKPQYLEYYSNVVTIYSMNESKLNIYTFSMEKAEGANGKVVKYVASETPDDGEDDTTVTLTPDANAVDPVVGTAYKLGLVHGTNAKTYYISGGMAQTYYLATNEAAASGLDTYVETATNGYYLYVMENGTKKYINLVVSGTHVNAVYSETAETVYTYDATIKTLKASATVEGATNDYILGTRNDKTYDTVGFCTVSSAPFYCQFFAITEGENPGTSENPGTGDDNTDDGVMSIPEVLASAEGTAVVVKGTVSEIYQAWSDQHSNISFYISDEAGNKLLVFRTGTNAKVGDKVTVTGTATLYNSVIQIAQGGITVIDEAHVCSQYTEATCTNLAACVVCGTTTGELAGHNFVNGTCGVCGAVEGVNYSTESMSVAANTGVLSSDSLSISWTGTNFTFTAQKGTNNNAIRTSDSDHFRVYQGNNVIISGNNGAKLSMVVFTCTSSSYAEVMVKSANTADGVTATASGSVVTLVLAESVNSITYSTTAQTRINNIEVTYVAA